MTRTARNGRLSLLQFIGRSSLLQSQELASLHLTSLSERRAFTAFDLMSYCVSLIRFIAVACVYGCLPGPAEMHNGRPLFPGANEADELDHIFRALGTPDEANFPGIGELPEYKPASYKRYAPPEVSKTLS